MDEQDLERKIAGLEAELRECRAARDFQLFADSVRDFAFIALDLENRVVSWNRGAEKLLGYSEAEIRGQWGGIFFTAEDQASGAVEGELETARRTGRAEDERWHVRKDGSRFWGSGVATPLYDADKKPGGYAKVMRDRTQDKLTEDQLRASEERLSLFIENVRESALLQLDAEGRITVWNPGAARILGYAADEAIGHEAAALLTADEVDAERMRQELRTAAMRGHAADESWMQRNDGSRLYARWTTNAIRQNDGELTGFVKVLRDETQRKLSDQAEALEREVLPDEVKSTRSALHRSMEELNRLAGQLISAHEQERRRIARELHDHFVQRLALVEIGIAQIRQDPTTEVKRELGRIQNQIATVSDDLRELSHRLYPAILEHLGLAAAVRNLAEHFRARHQGPVEVAVPEELPRLSMEAGTALYRICEEALTNIAKHAPDAGVAIQLSASDGVLRLTIRDQGSGFDLGAVRSKSTLGLISMQDRAQLTQATLTINSSPGRGTTVSVALPLNGSMNEEQRS